MTGAEWKIVQDRLNTPYGRVVLLVDGYKVTLAIERLSRRRIEYGIMIYINGLFKGRWTTEDCEERRRFFRKIKRKLYSRQKIAKMFPTKHSQKGELYKSVNESFIEYYVPYWLSFNPLKRHLLANNKSIELVEKEAA